jgi:hypothetical protein
MRPCLARLVLFSALVAPAGASAEPAGIEHVEPPIEGFYGKRLLAGAIPILAHESVSDEALLVARARLDRLLARAPALRVNLEAAHHEIHVVGLRQFTSDLPEHRAGRGSRLDTGELFDWHMIGGHIVGRLSSCTEGTLLPIVGHRLYGEDPCTHELAHAVERLALGPEARRRIVDGYRRAMQAGRWRGRYPSKNAHEWFAEATRLYFHDESKALSFYDPALAHGPTWLRAEDPDAFALVDALYTGGLPPGRPRTATPALTPGRDEARLRSRESRTPVALVVRNRSGSPVRLVWIDFEGHRDPRAPFAALPRIDAGGELEQSSWATHAFVVTDDAGRALCTFVLGEDDALVDIRGACP